MTNARRRANRLRRLVLLAGSLFVVAALCWIVLPYFGRYLQIDFSPAGIMGSPFVVTDIPSRFAYAVYVTLVLGLLLLAQWGFLRPGVGWSARAAITARPLESAVVAAAAMAMLLTVGSLALLLELMGRWEPLENTLVLERVWAGMLLLWGFWAWVFFVYWRQGDRYTQMGKMIRGLVAGSLLEAVVTVPAHIWATRKSNCYCEHGTYTALVFSGTVLLWAFGPGIVLLYMRERYRHARLFPRCVKCNYDLRGSTERCPECGTSFEAAKE